MTPAEAQVLLSMAAAFDNRKPDADTARAWSAVLDGLRFDDCRDALIEHYKTSTEYLMPVMIRRGVKRLRSARMDNYGPIPAPDHLGALADADFDRAYDEYIDETMRAIADGDLLPNELPVPLRGLALERKPRDMSALGMVGKPVPRD